MILLFLVGSQAGRKWQARLLENQIIELEKLFELLKTWMRKKVFQFEKLLHSAEVVALLENQYIF